jgi:hypothetical protein
LTTAELTDGLLEELREPDGFCEPLPALYAHRALRGAFGEARVNDLVDVDGEVAIDLIDLWKVAGDQLVGSMALTVIAEELPSL